MSAPVECPGMERWQALFHDDLPPEERDRCERHLDSCPRCQERLDHSEGFTEALRALARRVGDPTLAPPDPTWSTFLERLQGVRSTLQARPGEPADLYFLRPSDRPGVLGTLGDYEVREVIGQGGMGVVLKAFEPALNRFVAIKVMAAAVAGSATARRRFTREAQAAAAVCHDHVVAVHGVHESEGLPYLVMQYVAGESLQERIDRTGPLEVEEVVRIGLQTASGLAAAHAQGLIHRDVKPANLLLEDGLARVKITDFGLARMADDAGLTRDGVVAGTPEYMAPEQARGEPTDHRADLYALGAVLYACCTGRPPFRGPSAVAVLRRVSDEEPVPVRARNPEAPAWLEALIARLLAKAPADRFQTAAEVAALLEGYLAHLRQPATSRAPELPPPPAAGRRGVFGLPPVQGMLRWLGSPPGLVVLVLAAALAAGGAWLAGAGASPSDFQEYDQSFKGGSGCPPGFRLFGPGAEENVRFQPDGLRIIVPPGSPGNGDATGVRSLFGVRGDFEITVNFEVLAESPPADPNRHMRFTLETPLDGPDADATSLSRRTGAQGKADFQPWVRLWNEAANRSEQSDKHVPTTARSGRLRIARTGPVFSYYAAEGPAADFILLRKHRAGDEDLKEVVLAAAAEDSQGSLDVLAHDLHIRAQALPGLPESAAAAPAMAKERGWLAAAAVIALLLTSALVGGWLLARRNRRGRKSPDTVVKPASAGPVSFVCPHCGHGMKVKAELAGKKGKCPKCGQVVHVPSGATDAPATSPGTAGRRSRAVPLLVAGLALGVPLLALVVVVGSRRLLRHEPPQAPPQQASFIGVSLGGEPVPGVDESGFSYQEYDGREPFRWTDGDGRLVIPIDKAAPPQALAVYLHAYRRPGVNSATLQITANGKDLFNGRVHLGRWARTFDLRGIDLGDRLVVELKSDTFNPTGTPGIDGKTPSDDDRKLGVQVRSIRLLPRPPEAPEPAAPAPAPAATPRTGAPPAPVEPHGRPRP